MPEIGEMSYGYDNGGVVQYLFDIRSESLQTAITNVQNIDQIKDVCDATWAGKSKDAFISNLRKDADHVAEQFDALYRVLVREINSVRAAMANKDEDLIKES